MLKNILKIFTGTFISRVLGFIREIIVALFFGTGRIADAFTLALIFPNLFRQVLGEDMVERAFMPPFKTRYDQGEKARSWKFLSVVFNWFFIMLLVVTFFLYLVIPLFFSLKDSFPEVFGFIFKDQGFDYDLTLKLILILLPFTIFIGIAAFLGSLLNFFEKNWIFGLAPASLSIGVILGIFTLKPFIGGYSIAVGYVFGAFLQMAIQIPFVFSKRFKKESGLKYKGFKLKDPKENFTTIKRESKLITWNALFDKTQEIFGRFFAATLIAGSTSSLFYAARLFQLPFAIFSLPITRGINPRLNQLKAQNNKTEFDRNFQHGMNLYLILFFPITTLMIIAAPEIIDLVFRRGNFDSGSLALTSKAFMMYALGLLPMSLVGYFKRVLSLFDKNRYALNISIIGAVLNISFALFLVKVIHTGHEGIALASSISFLINMLILGYFLRKELGGFVQRKIPWLQNAIMILLAAAMILVARQFDLYFYEDKLTSFLSLTLKTSITFMVFGVYFRTDRKLYAAIRSMVRKNK